MPFHLPPFIRADRMIRFVEVVLFVALCVLIVRWLMIIFSGAVLPVPPRADSPAGSPRSNVAAEMLRTARLFGSHPAGSLSENVQAIGVIASHSGTGDGSAIISVDGRPPRAYRIGSDVEGRTLVAIRAQEVEMEGNGVRQVFRLPLRTPSAGGFTAARGGPTPDFAQRPIPPSGPQLPQQLPQQPQYPVPPQPAGVQFGGNAMNPTNPTGVQQPDAQR